MIWTLLMMLFNKLSSVVTLIVLNSRVISQDHQLEDVIEPFNKEGMVIKKRKI